MDGGIVRRENRLYQESSTDDVIDGAEWFEEQWDILEQRAVINPSLFCDLTLLLEASVTSFTIRSTACVCEGNLIKSQPSIGTSSCIIFRSSCELICLRTGDGVTLQACQSIMMPVNSYVICSRNNDEHNFLLANFSIYEYVINALLDDFSNLIFLRCDGTVVNTGEFNGVIRRHELKLHRPIQ
ncbi:hypothetical protein AVEN_131528-1 [Araneus ventricosus]|uniref:Uncharacterized protein n=1 Tax=Araneus ventricosus TaxID=182803 RepID=A0A4Y2NT74_ARAVE|nr:hypothetical protein AVEN_131528-1 [Araneus ventricosus]